MPFWRSENRVGPVCLQLVRLRLQGGAFIVSYIIIE